MLTADRSLTDKCTPGNRVKIMGILCVSGGNRPGNRGPSQNKVKISYIRVLGI